MSHTVIESLALIAAFGGGVVWRSAVQANEFWWAISAIVFVLIVPPILMALS